MKNLVNTVQLIGHLGRDPELRETQSGRSLLNASLATTDVYYNQEGEKVQDTQWHRLIAWGKIAENMDKLLNKGQHVLVQGHLNTRSYEDKEGVTKYITEVIIDNFLKLSKANGKSNN